MENDIYFALTSLHVAILKTKLQYVCMWRWVCVCVCGCGVNVDAHVEMVCNLCKAGIMFEHLKSFSSLSCMHISVFSVMSDDYDGS